MRYLIELRADKADDMTKDPQGYKENEKVRVREPKSSNIWLIDRAYPRGKHWKYVLKNPDNETEFYNGAEEVEENRLRSAG
jgi:hypothetical protein